MRYLLWALLIYFLYRFLKSSLKKGQIGRRNQGSPKEAVTDLLMKDPVCQTYIPRESAYVAAIEGQEYYFCSEACRDRFIENKNKAKEGNGK